MIDEKLKKQMEEVALEVVKKYNKGSSFSDRKPTDTPTDSFQVVSRRFVTLNGAVTARPVSSVAVIGQFFMATDTAIPMWYTVAGWRNGLGSIVAQNN